MNEDRVDKIVSSVMMIIGYGGMASCIVNHNSDHIDLVVRIMIMTITVSMIIVLEAMMITRIVEGCSSSIQRCKCGCGIESCSCLSLSHDAAVIDE